MKDERRRKTRVFFETRVVLKTKDSELTTLSDSRNISIKGIYVRADRKIPVGTGCDIEIVLTGTTSRLSLKVKGIIARHDEGGMGISFEAVEVDSYYHLKNLLMYNAEDPAELEKELQTPVK